nr:lysine-specific histone demethylase 1 homolog 3 [Tanacetum cinerariifolium]
SSLTAALTMLMKNSSINLLKRGFNIDLNANCVTIKLVVQLKNGKQVNDPILPLPKMGSKILVVGSHANNLGYQCNWWTIRLQGFKENGNTSLNISSGNLFCSAKRKVSCWSSIWCDGSDGLTWLFGFVLKAISMKLRATLTSGTNLLGDEPFKIEPNAYVALLFVFNHVSEYSIQSGESAGVDISIFTKAWVDSAGSEGSKDHSVIDRWQSQATSVDSDFFNRLHVMDEEDSNINLKQSIHRYDGLANESSASYVNVNREMVRS